MSGLRVAPPRRTVLLMAALHGLLATEWWWSSPRRASGPGFADLVRIGQHLDPDRPMWLWALAFTTVAAVLVAGAETRNSRVAGAGCLAGAGLLAFYGIASGFAALRGPGAPFTGLIVFAVVAVWHALNALMLTDRPDPWKA